MRYNIYLLILTIVVIFSGCTSGSEKKQENAADQNIEITKVSAEDDLGWRLGSQAYSFKEFTFAETLEKLESIGVKYVEAYRGQQIGGGIEGTTHYTMDAETRNKIRQLLDEKGIKMVCYGVVRGKDEADWKAIFDFADDMGIETLTVEPEPEQFDFLEEMADEYKINLAIHNHPKPSRYWHPDSVLAVTAGRSSRIGACADVGHWVRSGLDPIECLRKLEGKIISLHFKDLSEKSREAHDVPWGSGISNAKGMLEELKRQRFRGVFSIEYEHNWLQSLPEIKQSVDFFNKTAAEI